MKKNDEKIVGRELDSLEKKVFGKLNMLSRAPEL